MSKLLLGFAITAAFISVPVAMVWNPLNVSERDSIGSYSEVVGQDVAEVGELVRFLAEGEIVKWQCLPDTPDSESYGEFNENYVVSFRQAGVYTVVTAIYNAGELEIFTQEVTIEGPALPIVVDPVVIVIPQRIDESLVDRVEGWATKYRVQKSTCLQLAENFESVVADIQVGLLLTPGQIILETADLNSGLKLSRNLMAELQGYINSQADIGELRTLEQHIGVWLSIAKGLRNAAS